MEISDFLFTHCLWLLKLRLTIVTVYDINDHVTWFVSDSQAQDYITAGACMALGLRFAGSANSDAFECLYEFARTFMKIMSFAGTAAVVSVSIFIHLLCCFTNLQFKMVPYTCPFLSLSLSKYALVPTADGLL